MFAFHFLTTFWLQNGPQIKPKSIENAAWNLILFSTPFLIVLQWLFASFFYSYLLLAAFWSSAFHFLKKLKTHISQKKLWIRKVGREVILCFLQKCNEFLHPSKNMFENGHFCDAKRAPVWDHFRSKNAKKEGGQKDTIGSASSPLFL